MRERELIDALRAGDESAYAELHARYDARLHALARARGCSHAVAQEAVQETWASVARGIHAFEGRSSLKAWIFRILVNAAHASTKRERRLALVPDPDPGHASPSAHEHVVWKETLGRVHDAIEELPSAQRTVIELRDLRGWSADEVCAHLEISDANQRVLLHRARAQVRTALAEYLRAA